MTGTKTHAFRALLAADEAGYDRVVVTMTTMAWTTQDRVVLVVHTPESPSDDEWHAFMSDDSVKQMRGVVVVANGTRLRPNQRAEVQKWFAHTKNRGAVVTNSAMTRGVVTALNWFNVPLKGFTPDQMDGAFDWVGVAPNHRDSAKTALEQLQRGLEHRARVNSG